MDISTLHNIQGSADSFLLSGIRNVRVDHLSDALKNYYTLLAEPELDPLTRVNVMFNSAIALSNFPAETEVDPTGYHTAEALRLYNEAIDILSKTEIPANHFKNCGAACLAGIRCRHDAKTITSSGMPIMTERFMVKTITGEFLPICLEMLSGLPTPRPASQIIDGTEGRNFKVETDDGKDLTPPYKEGLEKFWSLVARAGVNNFTGINGSPSCSVDMNYAGDRGEDGHFKDLRVPGKKGVIGYTAPKGFVAIRHNAPT